MKINLNDMVKFRLTQHGRDILSFKRYEYDCQTSFLPCNRDLFNPDIYYPDIYYYPHVIEKDGYCYMQLWEFMHTFGEYMVLSVGDMCIEGNELIFEEVSDG